MKPYINSKYALKGTFALASLAQKEERWFHFSGKARKMNHSPPLARAKRARELSSLDFMYGFKVS
ncbi:MAG: hypothetical protein U5L45_26805 [Saprospiraceae bacterium]|nr:hypothetical protein [Saprospiraceae bacterium]